MTDAAGDGSGTDSQQHLLQLVTNQLQVKRDTLVSNFLHTVYIVILLWRITHQSCFCFQVFLKLMCYSDMH